MANVPLGVGAYSRPYGNMPEIKLENRFFEQNPVGAEKVSLLSRPGSELFLEIGAGPIRTLFSQAGVFNEDLFIISGNAVYRYDGVVTTNITGAVAGGSTYPVITALAIPEWEAIFITDGATLQYYEGEGRAGGTLTSGGNPANNDEVRIDDTYYKFTTGDVNTGTPAGTAANPWLVKIGTTAAASFTNLFDAINLTGTAGTSYSTATTIHPTVRAYQLDATVTPSLKVRANTGGVGGNSIVTTETGAGLLWVNGGTLTGGGSHALKTVTVPSGIVFSDLASLASHVICVEADSRRFFWIRPGEVVVDELDFSSAESEPDFIVNVAAVGDQLWFFGQSSTEAWYASGDVDQPFLRTQGRAFSQGIIPGTLAQFQDFVMVIGQDRVAYLIAGTPERISHHGIEEKIRLWQE